MSGTNQDLQSYLDSMNEGSESLITLSSDVVEALAGSDVLAQKILTDVIDDGLDGAVEAGESGYFVVQDGDYYFEPKVETQKLKPKPTPSSALKNPSQARTSRSSNAIKTFVVSTTSKRKKIVAESDVTEKLDDGEEDDGNKPKYVYIRDHKKRLKPENKNEPDVCEDGKKVYDFNDSEADGREEEDVNDKEYFLPGKVVRLKPSVGSGGADGKGTVYRCLHCSYTASKRFLLSRHMKAHSTDRPYKCSVCERGFKVSASLLNHVNTHLGNKPYACKYCEMCFTTSGEMVRHVRYRHTGEKPHKCTECDYSSVEQSKLRRHMRCHTGERPYQCPHCTYASPDMFKLKRHMRTHTGEKPYECDICHARFTQSNSLKAHRLIHSVGDKPVFQCSFCPTTCGRKTDLRMHIQKLHNSTHPIKCKRCDKELPDRYSYKMHVKTHEGEKCYRCKMCTYASVSVRHLESHMLIHSDQKPFVCNHCNMAFRQRQLLKRHINLTHDMNYVPPTPRAKQHYCPHCNRSFTHKGNLMRHMETHDPDSDAQRQELKLKNGGCTQLRAGVGSSTGTSVSGRASYRLKEPNSDSEDNNGKDFNDDFENLEVDFDCTVVLEDEDDDEEMEDDEDEAEAHFDTSAEDFNYEIIETIDEDIDQKPVVISTKTSATKASMALDNEYSSEVKGVSVKTETIAKEFMSVEVNDGQQYMVVEVIQCEEENYDEDEIVDNDDAGDEVGESYITVQSDVNDIDSQLLISQRISKTGVENCFGFAEDEIESEDYNEHDAKATIELLHIIDDD